MLPLHGQLAVLRVDVVVVVDRELGQAKVADLDQVFGRHQYVAGSQVSVHNVLLFQVLHALHQQFRPTSPHRTSGRVENVPQETKTRQAERKDEGRGRLNIKTLS